jgi:hypothetical protein
MSRKPAVLCSAVIVGTLLLSGGAGAAATVTVDPSSPIVIPHRHTLKTKSIKSVRALPAGAESDRAITEQVVARLASDPNLAGVIRVATTDGIVTLTGMVRNTSMLHRAIELTERVDGVRGVNDDPLSTS